MYQLGHLLFDEVCSDPQLPSVRITNPRKGTTARVGPSRREGMTFGHAERRVAWHRSHDHQSVANDLQAVPDLRCFQAVHKGKGRLEWRFAFHFNTCLTTTLAIQSATEGGAGEH